MKIKLLKITFENLEEFKERTSKSVEDAIKRRTSSIQSKNVIIWSSVEAYQKFMSDQKYTILATILQYQPHSVYQVAKILNRAQQNVARDCDLLAGHGFIRFEETGKGRKSKIPKLAFDYNVIAIQMPKISYKIALEEVA